MYMKMVSIARPGAASPAAWLAGSLLVLAAAVSLVSPARAEGNEHQGRQQRSAAATALPLYAQECGACHLAFPAQLLPAASWQRLMGGLDKHFGVDASLDTAAAKPISAWLQHNAATSSQMAGSPPDDRITRSRWFVRQHDEVRAAVWKRASVHSPANCTACHAGAARGDFDEDGVRIPK
jgi:hypothetical protein